MTSTTMVDVRPDIRLENAPMTPLSCTTCAADVLVRKASWSQTTVQWSAEASATCLERRATQGRRFHGCAALARDIRAAAVRGELPVVDRAELRQNPMAGSDPGNELAQAFEEVMRGD